jgi:hypothetical protein
MAACQFVLTTHEKRLSTVMRRKPAKHSLIELLLIGIHGSKVAPNRPAVAWADWRSVTRTR